MTTFSDKPIAERILDCFPSGTYALHGLLQLLDIAESHEVKTAAVECSQQPRLRVNPDFVAQHASTSEKLLMLIMHELHHVLLGHTRLFPCVTWIDNLVFDAVINALLCRMFPEPEHTAFFTEFYDATAFPACLLRPPDGWKPDHDPGTPAGLLERNPPLADVYRALYSAKGTSCDELRRALEADAMAALPGSTLLIGDHGADGSVVGTLETRAPMLYEAVRQIVERWPQPPNPIRGRSLADLLEQSRVRPRRAPSNRYLLRGLLRRIAGPGAQQHGGRRAGSEAVRARSPIVVPDRRAIVLGALGVANFFYDSILSQKKVVPRGEQVHVYLDVSGSIGELKSVLYAALLDCRELVHPRVHLFSTQVVDVSPAELRRGKCESTGGTDIGCVARHIKENRIGRAVLVTDGYVGKPAGQERETLAGVVLGVALTPRGSTRDDLSGVTTHWIDLKGDSR